MNTQLLDLADIVINNRPLLANFEEIASIGEVNHAISFLSGVVYALDGSVYRLGEKLDYLQREKLLKMVL